MNFNEPQSLFSLWLEAFKVANRTFVRIILLGIILILPLGVLGGLCGFVGVKAPPLLVLFLILTFLYYIFLLVGGQLSVFRMLDSAVRNTHESLGENIFNSLLPAVYFFVYAILMGIVSVGVSFVANYTRSQIFVALVNLVFSLTVSLRLWFAPMAIATREMGPIEAIVYSWHLTSGKGYFKTLGTFFMSFVLPILTIIGLIALAYGAYVGIPLYFANSFDITHLSPIWYVLLFVLMLFLCFIGWCMYVFPFLVFTDLDAHYTEAKWGDDVDVMKDGRDVNVYAVKNAPAEEPELEDLTVEQSAVKTEVHSDNLQEHLDQVYKPQKPNVIQYEEEDRMPTILFDDSMAKQLEESHKMFTPDKKDDNNTPNKEGPSSIKMSK